MNFGEEDDFLDQLDYVNEQEYPSEPKMEIVENTLPIIKDIYENILINLDKKSTVNLGMASREMMKIVMPHIEKHDIIFYGVHVVEITHPASPDIQHKFEFDEEWKAKEFKKQQEEKSVWTVYSHQIRMCHLKKPKEKKQKKFVWYEMSDKETERYLEWINIGEKNKWFTSVGSDDTKIYSEWQNVGKYNNWFSRYENGEKEFEKNVWDTFENLSYE